MNHKGVRREKITISMDPDVLMEVKKKSEGYGLTVSSFLQIAGQNFELPIKKRSVSNEGEVSDDES